MANGQEQEAGAIVIALKAQVDSLEKGVGKSRETIKGFGGDVEQVAQQTTKGGEQISGTFATVERGSVRLAARLANVAQRFLGLQVALSALQQGGGKSMGRFQAAVTAAATGVQGFLGTVLALPTPVGVAMGAVIGFASAYRALSAASDDAAEKQKKIQKGLKENFDKASIAAGGAEFRSIIAGGQSGRVALAIRDAEDKLLATLELRSRIVKEIESIETQISSEAPAAEKKRLDLTKERVRLEELLQVMNRQPAAGASIGVHSSIAAVDAQLKELDDKAAERTRRLTLLRNSLLGLADVNVAAESIRKLNEELKDVKAEESYINAMTELKSEATAIQERVERGIITPMKGAEEQLENTNKQLNLMIENLEALKKSGNVSGSVNESIRRAQSEVAEAQFALAFAIDDENKKKQSARETVADDKALEKRIEGFHERFSEPLSEAIGSAVAQGILKGEPAMETLANVGRNLFVNFMDDSIKNFTAGMKSAFKDIAGAGGEALGSAFTAVLGIAGALFANRQNKSSQTFTGVDSQVESSKPLRGIIAGPANIAVASLHENLARVMVPVVEGIRVLGSIMNKVELNTRGGAGAGGSSGMELLGVPTA